MEQKEITGTIFDIQPFSVYDGPGIRTTVFLKGCNLRCKWCHNPESISPAPELLFYDDKCIGCMKCFEICPVKAHVITDEGHQIRRDLCILCGACTDSCYAGALKHSGAVMTAEAVFRRIEADQIYFEQSGGGVTFSGGEPVLQTAFLKELLRLCRLAGIHTAVDTAGCVPVSVYEGILSDTDLFLYDLKAFSSPLHRQLTGQPNERVFENLKYLLERRNQVILRVPCVKGANFEDVRRLPEFLQTLPNAVKLELLAYHRMGDAKSTALSREAEYFQTPSKEEMLELKQYFISCGIPAEYRE